MTITTEALLNRLTTYADRCRKLSEKFPKISYNIIYGNQLNRSSSSPGANYIEAIDAASYKEFILRLKICRKELKESDYWLVLIQKSNSEGALIVKEADELRKECDELIRIFTSSIITSERNQKIRKFSK